MAAAGAAVALVGALVVLGVLATGADAAPPDLPPPPAAGILPGPAPSDAAGVPGSWGPCVPDDDATDNCAGWALPPTQVPPFNGTDNAPNVIVGGDFTVPDVASAAAETEGLLAVGGAATFDKGYSIGVVGAGTGVTPGHREDMLLVGGDATVNGENTFVTLFGFSGTDFRTGTIRVGGANNFRDPSYVANGTYGRLGEVDSAIQSPSSPDTLNLLYDDVSVLETDHYTDLFGSDGKMAVYSQQCYAELSETTATEVLNESGPLALEQGTVTIGASSITLQSDGSGDLVVFDLPGTVGDTTTGPTVSIEGVAAGATVLVNTLTDGAVQQRFGGVSWDGQALENGARLLWNYPFATTIDIGGGTQFPGSVLVGEAASTTTIAFSGLNGRVYTPGDLNHDGSVFSLPGLEMHAYHFIGALGCVYEAAGTFTVTKEITGDGEDLVPADATFTVDWEVVAGAEVGRSGSLEVPADGTAVGGPTDLVPGDQVQFSEVGLPVLDGVAWGDVEISPNPATIAAGEPVAVTVSNVAELIRGGFAVTKDVTGDPGATTTEFTGTWTCDAPDADGNDSGTWTLTDGETLELDGFPLGTTCTITEDAPTDPDGTWDTTIEPVEITITEGEPTANLITVTNTFTLDTGTFQIVKAVVDGETSSIDEFTVNWTCVTPTADETSGSVTLTDADTSDPIGDFPVGTTCTVSEPEIDDPDGTWNADIDPNPITIDNDDQTTDLVTVTNTFVENPRGGFAVTKDVTGDPGATTTEFTGTWTCDAPDADGNDSGTWTLTDGETLELDGFPLGTTCTITEDAPTDPDGTWDTTIEPAEITITDGEPTATLITVTNTFTAPTPTTSSPPTTTDEVAVLPATTTTIGGGGALPATTTPNGGWGVLPATGSDLRGSLLAAGALVISGVLVLLAVRRSRARPELSSSSASSSSATSGAP